MMVELLLVIMISVILSLNLSVRVKEYDGSDHLYISEYTSALAKAMASKERVDFRPEVNISAPYPIYFNQNGTYNTPHTLIYLEWANGLSTTTISRLIQFQNAYTQSFLIIINSGQGSILS